MNNRYLYRIITSTIITLYLFCAPASADVDLTTKFTNQGGVANTRHNLTQSPIGSGSTNMDPYRNDYGEVCVYCHTPHAANTTTTLPLWNRTMSSATYTTYDTLGTSTLTSTIQQPGVNSLSCLSCHDGTLAVDSIINMPGSGGYSAAQQTSQNNTFLNQEWDNASGVDATVHIGLDGVNEGLGCLACHSADAGLVGAGATDFQLFAIGTDLTNDHPVGVSIPAGSPDFNTPTGTRSNISWFDNDADSRPDTDEIRLYNTGSGARVECASCHDPHGVAPTQGGVMNASFLRISNAGSSVCLTCHVK